MAKMSLVYSPVNAAYMFMFGDTPVALFGCPIFFTSRKEAVYEARMLGLKVSPSGFVTVDASETSRRSWHKA